MTAYEQLQALKNKGNTTVNTNEKPGVHKVLGNVIHASARTSERVFTTLDSVREIWTSGRLSVREEVAADIMAIINR